jgi:hypothetical protein
MAQFWIAIFFILLAVTQLFQSIKDINLPFPVYLVLGTVLAVASNFQHQFSFSTSQQLTSEITTLEPALAETTSPISTATDDREFDTTQVEESATKKNQIRATTLKSTQVRD